MISHQVLEGDSLEVLKTLPDQSIDCCVTSPPYWGLRDYGVEGQLGAETTPQEYVQKLTDIFMEVHRVLKNEGSLWLNLGDSYINTSPNGLKKKDMAGIPWRVAFSLQANGYYLRQDIIWSKGNCMPASVKDRCVTSHEYIFLLTKSPKYYFDHKAIKEPSLWFEKDKRSQRGATQSERAKGSEYACTKQGVYSADGLRNKRSVWTVNTKPYKEAHFATYPEKLIEPCILAGCPEGGTVLDPFSGAATTGLVALKQNKNYIGIELNPDYIEIGNNRMNKYLLEQYQFIMTKVE